MFVHFDRAIEQTGDFTMADGVLKMGTLYISHEVMQHEKWMYDKAITASMAQLSKYMGLDGLLKPSLVRKGDYSLTILDLRVTPTIVTFIGVPGRTRSPIIQELYVKA